MGQLQIIMRGGSLLPPFVRQSGSIIVSSRISCSVAFTDFAIS